MITSSSKLLHCLISQINKIAPSHIPPPFPPPPPPPIHFLSPTLWSLTFDHSTICFWPHHFTLLLTPTLPITTLTLSVGWCHVVRAGVSSVTRRQTGAPSCGGHCLDRRAMSRPYRSRSRPSSPIQQCGAAPSAPRAADL